MADDVTLPQIQACAIRVALLDASGVPLPGTNNLYTTDALTELQLTPVYEDGDEITEKNACGAVAITYKGADSLKRADVQLTVVTQDPYLTSLLALGEVLTDGTTEGYAFPPIGSVASNGVSIELWAKRVDNGALDDLYPYAWWTLPRVQNLRHGQRTFNSGAQLPVFTGQAVENPNWFDGPLNDWPVASDRLAQWFPAAHLPNTAAHAATLAAS